MNFEDLFDNWRQSLYTPQRWASTLATCLRFWFATTKLPRLRYEGDVVIFSDEEP